MVQIIQGFNPEMEQATQRQMALNQGLQSILGGLQGLQQQAQTQRQQALQEQQMAASLRQQGYDVTPEMIAQSLTPEPSGFAKFFGAESSQPVDLYAKRTKEYEQKMAMAAEDRANKKKQQDFQNQLALMKLSQEKNLKLADMNQKQKEMKGTGESLPKLNAEEKNKIGSIASGFQSLDTMIKSVDQGEGPSYISPDTPLVGSLVSDTPYSAAERTLSEVVGRLQSGGAIGAEEEKRFKAMGPRPGDAPDIQKQKLAAQKSFLENKLAAYNMKPEQLSGLGFQVSDSYKIKDSGRQAVASPQVDPAKLQRLQELRAKAGIK